MVGYPGVVSTCCVQALCPVKASACRPLLMNLTVGVSTGQRVSKGSMISCLAREAVFEGALEGCTGVERMGEGERVIQVAGTV